MEPGSVFAGRFTVAAVAGSGGMGTVYRARDAESGVDVALKVLDGKNDAGGDRFEREANALAQLHHDAIVGYVAHGTHDEQRWIAMRWLEGQSLSDALKIRRPTIAETIDLGVKIASGLAHAHRQGFVHRDLKPSNVFLVGGSFAAATIVDFGIARTTQAGETVTTTGSALGTPGYMAPEQARGSKGIDARADVFSFGCVLYCCLTGKSPFAADEPLAAMLRLALDEPALASELCEGIPQSLDELVASMLAKAPGNRPSDGEAVRRALEAIRAEPGAVAAVAPRTRANVGATCLVLVRTGSPPTGDEPSELERREHDIRDEIAKFGAELDFLPDRSMYVFVTGKEPAAQLASRGARAALALDSGLPRDFAMAMVTVWEVAEGTPAHTAIERAIALLPQGMREGIPIDDGTATLLEPKYTLYRDASGVRLVGEGALRSRPTFPTSPPATTSAAPPAPEPKRLSRPRTLVLAGIVLSAVAVVAVIAVVVAVSGGAPRSARHGAPTGPAAPSPVAAAPAHTTQVAAPRPGLGPLTGDCAEYRRVIECMHRKGRRAAVEFSLEELRMMGSVACRSYINALVSTGAAKGCAR